MGKTFVILLLLGAMLSFERADGLNCYICDDNNNNCADSSYEENEKDCESYYATSATTTNTDPTATATDPPPTATNPPTTATNPPTTATDQTTTLGTDAWKCFSYFETINDKKVQHRGCTTKEENKFCTATSKKEECKVCNEDLCNSAVKLAGFSSLWILLGIALFFTR